MKFVDSSIWLDHLADTNKDAVSLVKSDMKLYSSILTIFEVKKRLLKLRKSRSFIGLAMEFIKMRSVIINLNDEIVDSAVDLSLNKELYSIDALIYASALSLNIPLVTADNDFRGLQNVEIISN